MNTSCHNWTRHGLDDWSHHTWMHHIPLYKRVMSRINASCHVWLRHVTLCQIRIRPVTYECVVSLMKESCAHRLMPAESAELCKISDSSINATFPIYTTHLAIRHVGHVTYEIVVSNMNTSCHLWTRHVTLWMRHMARMNGSGARRLMPAEYIVHTSHMNGACHVWMHHVTYERVMCTHPAEYAVVC